MRLGSAARRLESVARASSATRDACSLGRWGAGRGGGGARRRGGSRHTTQTQLTGRHPCVGWRAGEYIQGPSVDVRMKRVERKVS